MCVDETLPEAKVYANTAIGFAKQLSWCQKEQ